MDQVTQRNIVSVGWLSVFILLFLFAQRPETAMASDFNTPWIYAQKTDSHARLLFRKVYLFQGKPRQASLSIATTGYCKVYVNECKIGTAPYIPLRFCNDTNAVRLTFDITPYLRGDSNVVAVLYSPLPRQKVERQKQIAISFYGTDHQGHVFSLVSDSSWLCREAWSRIAEDGTETIDQRKRDPQWKAASIQDIAMWMPASAASKTTASKYESGACQPIVSHVDTWYADSIRSSQITLPNAFYGFFRATIRGARKGQRIRLGQLLYICDGTMDEQAYPEFGATYTGGLSITGKKRLINTLDMVSIEKRKRLLYN